MNARVTAKHDTQQMLSNRLFLAFVTDTSGGLIEIRRQEQTTPDPTPYPSADGLAGSVSPGDLVLCVETAAQVVVVVKIVTS